MAFDKTQLNSMTTRQKAMAGIVGIVVIVVIWQIFGMFSSSSSSTTPPVSRNGGSISSAAPNGAMKPAQSPGTPQPAQLAPASQISSQEQAQLTKLQQDTQEGYVKSVNELQMLRLELQIAETNKNIAKAKLDTVTSQKGVVDLLTKPTTPETPAAYGPSLAPGQLVIQPSSPAGIPTAPVAQTTVTTVTTEQSAVNYIVISVSQLLNKWSAVLGYQGKLYSVFVGDVVPVDQSLVVAIDKYGVVLEKEGTQRRVSLVPLI